MRLTVDLSFSAKTGSETPSPPENTENSESANETATWARLRDEFPTLAQPLLLLKNPSAAGGTPLLAGIGRGRADLDPQIEERKLDLPHSRFTEVKN
jgi:hypothetical protein